MGRESELSSNRMTSVAEDMDVSIQSLTVSTVSTINLPAASPTDICSDSEAVAFLPEANNHENLSSELVTTKSCIL